MTDSNNNAPGWPGIAARWPSRATSGASAALNPASRVWFARSPGIFNEIYYPRLHKAYVRAMGLIVTDGTDFFSEEKRHCQHETEYLAPAIPAYKWTNTDQNGRYTITKEILADPQRDGVGPRTPFSPSSDRLGDYHLYVLLVSPLGNWGAESSNGALTGEIDRAETAGGRQAAGAQDDTRRILKFLQITRKADGHGPQNIGLDGSPYWGGLQRDETAFPILLVDGARCEGALTDEDRERVWPMGRRVAQFVVQHGPVSQQDRWKEDPGTSPFTLAVEIAALLVAADRAEECGPEDTAASLRQTVDTWNASIERWTYVTEPDLAEDADVGENFVVQVNGADNS